jgi:hypothetical protein
LIIVTFRERKMARMVGVFTGDTEEGSSTNAVKVTRFNSDIRDAFLL